VTRRRLAYTYSCDEEENGITNNQCAQQLKNVKAKLTKPAKSDPSLPLLPRAPQRSTKSMDQRPACITPQPSPGTSESMVIPPTSDHTLLALPGPSQSLPSTPGPSSMQHQSINLVVSGQSLPPTPGPSNIQSPSWVNQAPLTNSNRHSLPSPKTAPCVTGTFFILK